MEIPDFEFQEMQEMFVHRKETIRANIFSDVVTLFLQKCLKNDMNYSANWVDSSQVVPRNQLMVQYLINYLTDAGCLFYGAIVPVGPRTDSPI
ncbi:MAG: hypothetical protein ABIO19_10085 [Burkholderiaceae bacterium]